MDLLQQLRRTICRAGRERIFRVFPPQMIVGLDRSLRLPLVFRFLGNREKLLRVSIDLLIPGRDVFHFFTGAEDNGRPRPASQKPYSKD
jgi:hypothetical protein